MWVSVWARVLALPTNTPTHTPSASFTLVLCVHAPGGRGRVRPTLRICQRAAVASSLPPSSHTTHQLGCLLDPARFIIRRRRAAARAAPVAGARALAPALAPRVVARPVPPPVDVAVVAAVGRRRVPAVHWRAAGVGVERDENNGRKTVDVCFFFFFCPVNPLSKHRFVRERQHQPVPADASLAAPHTHTHAHFTLFQHAPPHGQQPARVARGARRAAARVRRGAVGGLCCQGAVR